MRPFVVFAAMIGVAVVAPLTTVTPRAVQTAQSGGAVASDKSLKATDDEAAKVLPPVQRALAVLRPPTLVAPESPNSPIYLNAFKNTVSSSRRILPATTV